MSDAAELRLAEGHSESTVVLGIGNTLMCDDGVGAVVARELVGRLPGATVVERQIADMGLIRLFTSGARIFVVDAVDCGGPPGAIYRFTPDEGGITTLRSNNIHGMGVGFLVANARLTGARPDVTIFGVQVGSIMPDPERLTPEVAQAAAEVVRLIEAEVEAAEPTQRDAAQHEAVV